MSNINTISFPYRPSSFVDLIKIFGDPDIYKDSKGWHVSSKWESNNLVLINTGLELPKRVYCHEIFAPHLSNALSEINNEGLSHLIYTWDGCFSVRPIGHTTIPSSHCFAVSIDLNSKLNPQGFDKSWYTNPSPNKMDMRLVNAFKRNKMCWGEEFKNHDPMHFSLIYW